MRSTISGNSASSIAYAPDDAIAAKPQTRAEKRAAAKAAKEETVHRRDVFTVFTPLPDDEWVAGQTMDRADYREYLRDLYKEANEENADLDDVVIDNIIDRFEGDTEEATMARVEAMENEDVEETDDNATSSVSAVRSAGFGIGAKLDAETLDHMAAVENAKEVLDGSALLVALDIQRNFPKEQREGWPIAGSSWDDADRVEAASKGRVLNTPPDHYKEGKTRGSFYGDMVDGSPWGKRVRDVRDVFAKIKAGNEGLTDIEDNLMRSIGYPQWRSLKDKDMRESEETRWASKRTNMATRFRRAAQYLSHAEEMTAAIDGLDVELVQEPDYLDKGTPTQRLNPLSPILRKTNCLCLSWVGRVDNKRKTVKSSAMSINKFNRLLIKDRQEERDSRGKVTVKAAKGAVTYIKEGLTAIAALEKTVERPPRKRGSEAEGASIPISNINGKMAWSMMAGLSAFFDDAKKQPTLLAQLSTELTGSNERAQIKSAGEFRDAVESWFKPYETSYNVIVDQDTTRAAEEARLRIQKGTGETLTPAAIRRRKEEEDKAA